MPNDGRIYEGHTFVFGQDNDTEPSALKSSVSAKAVNRIFRGGRNRTRPPFLDLPCDFDVDSEVYRDIFLYGNFQGWSVYKKKKPGRETGLVVAIAGRIFFLVLVNERWLVRFVMEGNNPNLMHTWFCQAEEWLYIQNGEQMPIFWDGMFPSGARRADPTQNEMPVGTLMAYAHGRVFISNAFDQVAASDIIYGGGLTNSDATQKFTENEYWTEGGYFGMPTELGRISGMIVLPRMRSTINGQGELVILNEEGASSIEASVPRGQWKNTQIQQVTMSGRGPIAPGTVIAVNNDCWFRSDDGLASYRITQSDTANSLSLTKLSRQVNEWFSGDTEWLKQFGSATYFDNRIITTVSPQMEQSESEEYGSHRFHRGMVVLDLDRASDVQGDESFNWDGLWTGIRPCAVIKMGQRAFAFSYDSDGQNRIYEIARNGLSNDRFDGKNIKTKWFYFTKKFDWSSTQQSNSFEVKKLVGGHLWISEITDRILVGVDYRPDNLPCWKYVMQPQEFGSDFEEEYKFSLPRYKRWSFLTPESGCEPGAPYPFDHGAEHQFMIYGEGRVKVDRMRVAMAGFNDPNTPGDCKPDNPKIQLDCHQESDYSYDIAEEAAKL